MALPRIASMGLALLLGASAPAFAEEGNVDEGREVFKFRCWNCHMSPEGTLPEFPEQSTTPGPTMVGVIGRTAGTAEGYDYSDALQESGVVWTASTLTSWLREPRAFIPLNGMPFIGLKRAGEMEDVIAYLLATGRP